MTAEDTFVPGCYRCATASTRAGYEKFSLMLLEWDVAQARALVAGRAPIDMAVSALSKLLGMVYVDLDHVGHVPLSDGEPIIYAVWIDAAGQSFSIPIDGWHRIARAAAEGRKTIPAQVLTLEESNACRLDSPVYPSQRPARPVRRRPTRP